MRKSRIFKIVKASFMLVFFFVMSTLGFKRYDNFQLKNMDEADKGFKIGKMSLQIGMPEAHGMCGAGMSCSGGGGMCGAGMNCGGGGGMCGAGMSCSGGGGMCGAGMNCGGE